MAKKGALQDLEAKLADRAEANVQARIKAFKADIEAALAKLVGTIPTGQRGSNKFGTYYYHESGRDWDVQAAKHDALNLAICDHVEGQNTKLSWPSILWYLEQHRLRDELLAKMDLMQQLINSPARDTSDDVPHESEV